MIFSLGKHETKLLAYERISILIHSAIEEKHQNYHLANDQAQLAKKIAKRVRLKLPYNIRQFYCKKCKNFISPGYNSRVRIGRSKVKALRITCLKCNYVYRKLL
jgi:ribonuclease P protein subunit RPR2